MFHYLLNIIVFQFRVVSLEYFMDRCSVWELNDIIENLPYLDRNIWETARLNTYVVAQVNSKKHLTQQDILKFKWEEENKEDFVQPERDYEISNNDIDRLKELSKSWEKQN